jgi:hypothetical protein
MMSSFKIALPALALVMLSACDPYGAYCSRVGQCADDNEDGFDHIDVDDDYQGVCEAQMRYPERVLRANKEDECQVMADAYRAWIGCLASLDCDDLNDEVREPDKCEDERDDYDDAIEDADGDCQTSSYGAASCATLDANTAPGLLALVALGLRVRSRRSRRSV